MPGLPTCSTPPGDALLVATTNPGKIREIREILDGLPIRLLTLSDLSSTDSGAGRKRAGHSRRTPRSRPWPTRRASGLPTVAEDSGLAIDALGGRPGVESARYPGRDYPERFVNLYRELAPSPASVDRALRLLARVRAPAQRDAPPDVLFATEATVEGEIADAAARHERLRLRPDLLLSAVRVHLGEVDAVRKLAVAHRGKAFRRLRA